MSITKYDSPRCLGRSKSVRASSRPQSAWWALVVHTFWPLITQRPSLSSARVRAPARSEPLPGSLKSWHQLSSPVRMRRRNFALWKSPPCSSRVAAARPLTPLRATLTAPMRRISSATIASYSGGRPLPCHCAGQLGMPQPESISRLRHSARPSSAFQLASSQARASARTAASVGWLMVPSIGSHPPRLQHPLAVPGRVAQEHLGALGALEPEVGVVVPGEADPAVDLDGVDGGLQIGLGRTGLGQSGDRRQLGVIL